MTKKIFLDSSVLYAFVDRANANFAQSTNILKQLSNQGTYLYTSLQSVTETQAAISQQLGTTLGLEFLKLLTESNIEILYPQKSDFIAAYKIMKMNSAKQLSLKECLIVVLMNKKNIYEICTFGYWNNLMGSISYLSRQM
jgi:predicted nucleic acid-binding protein